MGISHADFLAMEMRTAKNRGYGMPATRSSWRTPKPVEREADLHRDIMDFCDRQQPWPWKYIRCRMDRESTITEGAHDFTIFGIYPLCILVEAKARNEKQKPKQLIWAAEMARLGWTVHVVRSMPEFLSITTNA